MNYEFKFSDSEKYHTVLVNALEKVGANLASIKQQYLNKIWQLECPWIEDDIQLVWEQMWDPDGMETVDVGLRIVVKEEIIDSVEFDDLIKAPDGGNLRERIITAAVRMVANVTGKTYRG